LAQGASDEAVLDEICLATFARHPTAEETQEALAHLARSPDRRKAWEDLQWALFNTREFMLRH
jgi:hypothetical protein